MNDPPIAESLVIRPPSEWGSLLVRLTRGCHWNRCRFCGIYPALGEPTFSVRSVEEIKGDIDRLRAQVGCARTAFLGDADPLQIGMEEFIEVTRYLRGRFPEIRRLTCYARASTLRQLGPAGIARLSAGGLNRVHIGLETGDMELLRLHRKGQTPDMVVESGRWLKRAGIQISYYVLLGMGGRDRWQDHIDETAAVVNKVDPEFIRLRRIWLYGRDETGEECPLWEEIRGGTFVPQTPEGTVLELRRLLQRLDGIHTVVTCDHANNYVRIEGRLPADRDAMLQQIDAFLALPPEDRHAHYAAVGSRV